MLKRRLTKKVARAVRRHQLPVCALARELPTSNDIQAVGHLVDAAYEVVRPEVALLKLLGKAEALRRGQARQQRQLLQEGRACRQLLGADGLHHFAEGQPLNRPQPALGSARHRGLTRSIVEEGELPKRRPGRVACHHLAVARHLVRTAAHDVERLLERILHDDRLTCCCKLRLGLTDDLVELVVLEIVEDLILADRLLDPRRLLWLLLLRLLRALLLCAAHHLGSHPASHGLAASHDGIALLVVSVDAIGHLARDCRASPLRWL